jgi:hypothetical protein
LLELCRAPAVVDKVNTATVSRAIATPHFDHQVKEARLSYAERQQSSTKSTLQCCERKLLQKNEKFLVKYS